MVTAWLQGGGRREDHAGCSMVEETPMEDSRGLVVSEHDPKGCALKVWFPSQVRVRWREILRSGACWEMG